MAGRADGEPVAVVGEHVELHYLVDGERSRPIELGHHRVHPAGVVAEHAAQRVAIVGRGIGTEREAVHLRRIPEHVEVAAGLDDGEAGHGVDVHDPVEVLRAVDDDCDIGSLSGEARAAAACGDRRAVAPARRDGRDDVVDGRRHDDPDRDLAVVRRVGRVRGPAPGVEADLAGYRSPEVGGELLVPVVVRVGEPHGIDRRQAVVPVRCGHGCFPFISFIVGTVRRRCA